MKKNYLTLVWVLLMLLFTKTHAQLWEAVGPATGVSAGGSGRLSLINDYQDNLLLGYYDVMVGKGNVQKYANAEWSYLGDSPEGITPGFATFNSLSADAQGNVYFTNQGPNFQVRRYEGANQIWEELYTGTANVNYQSSAVAPNGVLFIASGEDSGTIRRYVNDQWEQVGTAGFFGGVPTFLDMAIGTNGKVYISFNNAGAVHVYENDITAPSTQEWTAVGGEPDVAVASASENYNSSLTIDAENSLYICYVSNGAGGNKLNVKKFSNYEWTQLGAENFSSSRVQHNSIAVGTNGIVYVAVSNWEDTDFLKNYVLAYDAVSNSWSQAGNGFASEGQATHNSLAIDSSGNLFLAFYDSALEKISVKKLNLEVVAAGSIEIVTQDDVPATITADNGTLQLQANVLPLEASQTVVWSMESGETFATISETGLVTAIASNSVITVKATSVENTSIFDTIEITITNQDSEIAAEELKITFEEDYPDIYALNATLQLHTTILPLEANQEVIWTVTSGTNVVGIDANGLVTSLAEGTATIVATSMDGTVSDQVVVNVFSNGCTQGNNSIDFGLGYSITLDGVKGSDDFIVAEGTRLTVKKIRLSVLMLPDTQITSVNLNFLKDLGGRPGTELISISNIIPTSQILREVFDYDINQYDIELDLPEPIVFDQGTYWLNPEATNSAATPVYWDVTPDATLGSSYHINYLTCNGWTPLFEGGMNGVFELTGNCTPMPITINAPEASNAEVAIANTIALSATVSAQPGAAIVWTVTAGQEYASVSNAGIVTGLAVGTATIRAAVDANLYTEYDIKVVYPNACVQEVLPNNQENGYFFAQQRLATDITVEDGQFTIHSVEPNIVQCATNFNFVFYTSVDGLPGAEIMSTGGTITDQMSAGADFSVYFNRYVVALDTPITLTAGTYWMEIQTDGTGWETTTASVQGQYAAFRNVNSNQWLLSADEEYVYKINGSCGVICSTDTTPPIVSLQNATAVMAEGGSVTLTPEMFDNGSTDNCTIASMSVTPTTFNCSQLGVQTVTVTVTDAAGNTATGTAQVTLSDPEEYCQLSTVEHSLEDFKLYPNPATEVINLSVPTGIAIETASIYSLLGQKIITINYTNLNANNNGEYSIPIQGLQSGTYLIEASTSGGTITRKFIKL